MEFPSIIPSLRDLELVELQKRLADEFDPIKALGVPAKYLKNKKS